MYTTDVVTGHAVSHKILPGGAKVLVLDMCLLRNHENISFRNKAANIIVDSSGTIGAILEMMLI